MGAIVVAAICVPWRSRRCCGRTSYGAQTSSYRSADASAMTPARDGTDHRTGAGPEQAAGNGALARIVRVRVGRCRQQQSGADYTWSSRSLAYLILCVSVRSGAAPDLLRCAPRS